MSIYTNFRNIVLSLLIASTSISPAAAASGETYYYRFNKELLNLDGKPLPGSSSVVLNGKKGENLSASVSFDPKYAWSVKDGAVPAGVGFDASTGVFSGVPSSAGNSTIRYSGVDAATGATFLLTVSFVIQDSVAPGTPSDAVPDIADQPKTILGTQGLALSTWKPMAASGWASGVVNNDSRGVWNEPGTTYEASADLTQYGLTFDSATGTISGTPTQGFIIPDFAVTVKAGNGTSDKTAPFWLGVAPAAPIEVVADQEGVYSLRQNKAFTTQPLSVPDAIGTLTFSKPAGISDGWNSTSGVWALGDGPTPAEWVNNPVVHVTTITDEFGRTGQWSFITDFTEGLSATSGSVTAYIGTEYTPAKPLASPKVFGLVAMPTWDARDVPTGLSVDASTGVVTGKLSDTGGFTEGDEIDIPLTVTDSFDGASASTTLRVTTATSPFLTVNVNGDSQTVKAWTDQPSLKTVVRRRTDNASYTAGVTWELASGTLPEGVTAIKTNPGTSGGANYVDMTYTGYPKVTGTFGGIVWKATNSDGIEVLTKPITLVVQARDTLTLNASPSSDVDLTVGMSAPTATKITASNLALNQPIAADKWTVTGLPNGMGYDVANDGITLKGKPSQIGTFNATVTAIDASGTSANLELKIAVIPSTDGLVNAGGNHSCVLTPEGSVECWGLNSSGQLGNNSTTLSRTPVAVVGLSDVAAISTGQHHTCALTGSGGVKCWGNNSAGQLGTGNKTNSAVPVDVSGLTSGVSAVSAGYTHTCAVMLTGGVKCWGANGSGQLGDATNLEKLVPSDVSGLTGVASVATGVVHTCAVTKTGGAKCWGLNQYGALGNGTKANSNVPVNVTGLSSGVTSIQGGYRHTCAITTGGTAKCWGFNNVGQLGDNTTTDSTVPVDVVGLSNIVQLGLSEAIVCAAKSNGGAVCWGWNPAGGIGDGTTTDRRVPTQVSGLTSGVTSVSAGYQHACASLETGEIKCWGRNNEGQLGDGTSTNRLTPVTVLGN